MVGKRTNYLSWDEYFMKMANDVATRTTCLRRQGRQRGFYPLRAMP